MSASAATAGGAAPEPRKDVVLLCNPLAGGRWEHLAEVLDLPEAQGVRRIVTDEIDDLREALVGLGRRADLLCIYGGDGTIFRVLDQLVRDGADVMPRLALLGGGTMNVSARACGMGGAPAANFRAIMRAYRADRLTWRELPLLSVDDGAERHVGFTFGLGPLVRLVDHFERHDKRPVAAVTLAARAVLAAISGRGALAPLVRELEARVECDGEVLPHDHFAALFCNTTGTINPHVWPFAGARERESFHFLAYAAPVRTFAIFAPLLARGVLPLDPQTLRRPVSSLRRGALSLLAGGQGLPDPRFVNHSARHVRVTTAEPRYTIDGELFATKGAPLDVTRGPVVSLALRPARTW